MRVLIADDDPIARRLLEKNLVAWDYEVIACEDGTEAWSVFESASPPEMAVLDWMMPGMEGVEICRRVRARNAEPYTYIVLLTSRDRKSDLAAGLEAGADDFLNKPFHAIELRARLKVGRRILDLERRLSRSRDDFRQQAIHDPLTGLWNRRMILDFLNRTLARNVHRRKPTCAVMLDIDHFKEINDQFGHQKGDELLLEMAHRLAATLRPYDGFGRFGGEEFLVVLSECELEAATEVAERMRTALESSTFDNVAEGLRVTASFGVAKCKESSCPDPHALIQAADRVLYQAKKEGRNCVRGATAQTGLPG